MNPDSRAGQNCVPFLASLTANAISSAGNSFANLAIPWHVLATTGGAARMGIVGFAQLVPTILSSLFGGALVDRAGYKRISVIADLFSGCSVAAIPLLHATARLQFWQLLALVVLGSVFDAPGSTARSAVFQDLAELGGVPLERVNSLSLINQNVVAIDIPPLAGISIAWLGASQVLWIDAVSFSLSAGIYGALVPSIQHAPAGAEIERGHVLGGLRFLQRSRMLFTLLLFAAFINFLCSPLFSVVLAVFSRDVYGSARAFGLMLGGVAAGTLIGLAVYSAKGASWRRRPTMMIGFGLLSLPIFAVALVHSVWVAVAALAVAGVGIGPVNAVVTTMLQERTPPELRGRAFGAVTATVLVATPLGVLSAGVLVDGAGAQPVIVAIGVLLTIATLALAALPAIHEMDEPGRLV